MGRPSGRPIGVFGDHRADPSSPAAPLATMHEARSGRSHPVPVPAPVAGKKEDVVPQVYVKGVVSCTR